MNNQRSRTQKGGFTLAEILIAVAIASLIVAAVFAIFIQTRRQIHSQKTRSDMYQNLRFAMNTVAQDAMAASAYSFAGERLALTVRDTNGTARTVSYFIDTSSISGQPGLRCSASSAGSGAVENELIAEGIENLSAVSFNANTVEIRLTGRALRRDRMAVAEGQTDGLYRTALTNRVYMRNRGLR